MTDLAQSPRPATNEFGLLDSDTLVGRIFGHIDAGATDLADATWREPVANYRSEERLRAEVEVLRRHPVPFCPSVALPPGGSYLARAAAGVEIIAVRGTDGGVRAFRNACRHRGTALAAGPGCAKSLVCPFHGWVYGLDGQLRHVPDEHGFPGLDRSTRGLVAVSAVERGGLVFVQQDGPAGMDSAELDPAVPQLVGTDQELFESTSDVVEANWKVMVEGFLEGYHIRSTHKDTFFPLGYDNLTIIEHFGRHSRVTFPFRRIEAQRDVPVGQRQIDVAATTVHHLFPNAMLIRLSHHTVLVVLEPLSPTSTQFVAYRLANRPAEDGILAAKRDADFVESGLAQDRDIARAVQRGLTSCANETLEFGRFEGGIVHFHQQLHALIDG